MKTTLQKNVLLQATTLLCTALLLASPCLATVCSVDEDCFGGMCVGNVCVQCVVDADCDNGLFCDGAETCDNGTCSSGAYPCPGEFCNETNDVCLECLADDDCFGWFCVDNVCAECEFDSDCENGVYCDGDETCDNGTCTSGTDPCPGEVCDEPNARCVECLEESDCAEFYTCESNLCEAYPTFSNVTEVTLKGRGELTVIFDPNGIDIARIELTGTTKKSSLEIKSMLKNSIVYLDQVDIDGVLKSIKGDAVFLTGALTSNEGINQLELAGTDAGSLIDVPWIGKLKIATDFAGDMILTGEADPPKGITLKKADIKGMLWMSEWMISGIIGSIKTAFWGPGTTLAVGVDPGTDGEFFTNDDFATGGLLGNVKYKNYETYNAGVAFGIIADEFSKLKIDLPHREDDFRIEQAPPD